MADTIWFPISSTLIYHFRIYDYTHIYVCTLRVL